MPKAKRTDANQQEIIDALRKIGASVEDTSAVGNGFPDLVVGFRQKNFLLEVKDPAKPPSKRRLNPRQKIWHRDWRGQKAVVETPAQAIAIVTEQPLSSLS